MLLAIPKSAFQTSFEDSKKTLAYVIILYMRGLTTKEITTAEGNIFLSFLFVENGRFEFGLLSLKSTHYTNVYVRRLIVGCVQEVKTLRFHYVQNEVFWPKHFEMLSLCCKCFCVLADNMFYGPKLEY